MNINASIIDQRLTSVMPSIEDRVRAELGKVADDTDRLKSIAFVFLCVQIVLDLDDDEIFDCIVEGGNDFGIDGIHLSAVYDGEFIITIFQGKYKKKLDGEGAFPASGIEKLIQAVGYIFDPFVEIRQLNARLLSRVEEIRSLIKDGHIPRVRVIACNNGKTWSQEAQELINLSNFGEQVIWEHINHDKLLHFLQKTKAVTDVLRLSGKIIVEDMNFSRILIGRISVSEISELLKRHGEGLLERNIRRYLGLKGNRVNEDIKNTLLGEDKNNFYFYNNGVTMICDSFSYNGLQSVDHKINVKNLQIINGGQTCMTILRTLAESNDEELKDAYVMLRLYELPEGNDRLVHQITYATNSQNPVELRDLRANDEAQIRLETDISQLGYTYRRKRYEQGTKPQDITAGVAAEAVLAVWLRRPHQARFLGREHFGKLYDEIFSRDLTGAQVITAALLYRIAENHRKKLKDEPLCVQYASCFIAMQMGRRLLRDLKVIKITHKEFFDAQEIISSKGETYFQESVEDIEHSLRSLYGERDLSLQQLSATFRRGDLIEILLSIKLD